MSYTADNSLGPGTGAAMSKLRGGCLGLDGIRTANPVDLCLTQSDCTASQEHLSELEDPVFDA